MNTKERVLELLEANRSEHFSGERIAEMLGVSRSAVWKAAKELKRDGYGIEAITNKGYRLCESSDILSVQGMLPFLADPTYAESIHIHKELESTNRTAKELAISGAGHGMVVIADSQTGGRGRYGRGFCSPPGRGLYMSVILLPSRLHTESATSVTALAAVAVCKALEAVYSVSPLIKWVNDIFLNGKKICGILTEAVSDYESGSVQWAVVGIGINVTTNAEDFPNELRRIAGAVDPGGKRGILKNQLAAELINRVLDLCGESEAEIFSEYKKHLMALNERVIVIQDKNHFEAEVIGIDDAGRLMVKGADGCIHSLSYGEITLTSSPK